VHFKPENASRSKRLQEPTLKPMDLVDQALDPMHHYCLAATTAWPHKTIRNQQVSYKQKTYKS